MANPPAARAHRPWVQIPGLLTAAECAAIVALGATLPPAVGVIGTEDGGTERTEVRRSTVRWLDRTPAVAAILDRIAACLAEANAAHYGFALDGMPARLQLTEYAGEGKYDWHLDLDAGRAGMEPDRHLGRRLSFTVQLSPSEDYDGGDFQVRVFGREYTAAREPGAAIVFPAYQYHRVTPVRGGLRRSLVGWLEGPPTDDPRFRPRGEGRPSGVW